MVQNKRVFRFPVVMARPIFHCHIQTHRGYTVGVNTMTNTHIETTQNAASEASVRIALTTGEAAAYLGMAASTLNKWRCDGDGPHFLKLGRAVRYRQDDLDRFLETRMFRSTAEI